MTELTYTKNGDYLIPDLTLSETPEDARPLGKYGRLRRSYLQEHRPGLYSRLVLSEKLFPHLREIDEAANNRAGADDAGADEVSGRDGGAESPRSDEMGRADEHAEGAGRGNDPQRAGVQLTNDAPDAEPAQPPIPQAYQLSLFPSEAEQIASIAEAESYTPSAFSMSIPQADIDHILRADGNADYAAHENCHGVLQGQKCGRNRAAFLQSSFHGGNGVVTETADIPPGTRRTASTSPMGTRQDT